MFCLLVFIQDFFYYVFILQRLRRVITPKNPKDSKGMCRFCSVKQAVKIHMNKPLLSYLHMKYLKEPVKGKIHPHLSEGENNDRSCGFIFSN